MPFTASILQTHPTWQPLLKEALAAMDEHYLIELEQRTDWLPGLDKIFAAFQLPRHRTQYILLGESPYPRPASANGYAFWDAAVGSLWSATGLDKAVNRATSLRHLVKMLLHARGDLSVDFSQPAIAALDKTHYVQTASQLFQAFMHHGFLLLNACLVYREKKVQEDARYWRAFMATLLRELAVIQPSIQLVLLGRIAAQLPEAHLFSHFQAAHPYNVSFVTNAHVLDFFKPFDLLSHDFKH